MERTKEPAAFVVQFTKGEIVTEVPMERYDLVVIGGGAAGINALKEGIKLGATAALVDRGPLGGSCINRG